MTENDIQEIALKYFQGNTTPEEEVFLHQWYENMNNDNDIVIRTENEDIHDVKFRLFMRLQTEIIKNNKTKNIIKFVNRRRLYYAASIFFVLSFIGVGFYFIKQSSSRIHYTHLLKNDVAPGGNHAILELIDGTTINLDRANVGDLASLNGISVSKLADGILSFEISNSLTNKTNKTNTISTPQGGQYQIKLPDGTEVWLNASSSIKFPSAFGDDVREVELNGEAYFEVAQIKDKKNNRVPFLVKSKQQKIEVLGTHFNVNSYSDEQAVKTTLLEGSVRVFVDNSKSAHLLKPGQRSRIIDGKITIEPADIESELAWKNGDFIFNNESLSSIMKKIERWYDVKVVYENGGNDSKENNSKFSGAISRSKNLSSVLQIMELTGKVTFKIEGRRVFVMT